MGPPIIGNGTFNFERAAASDGKLSLIGIEDAASNCFIGSVDNFTVTAVD